MTPIFEFLSLAFVLFRNSPKNASIISRTTRFENNN